MDFTIKDFLSDGFAGKYFINHQNSQSALFVLIAAVALAIVSAYLLGSINFAIIISGKAYKQDIRSFGSKNAGMTNMMRTYGKKAAGYTLLGDALKAVFSCLIGYAALGNTGAYIAGLFCIIGHIFPIYYGFKGGKGVVTAAITILMCDPLVFLILFTFFVIIVALTKYISLGSVMCMLLYPVVLSMIAIPPIEHLACVMIIEALIIAKHWTNIKRLRNGTESKFSFKKSVKQPTEEVTNKEQDK